MRYENENNFIEISEAISSDHNDNPVLIVESNLELKNLPLAFHSQIKKSDTIATKKLERAVISWADDNNYDLVVDA